LIIILINNHIHSLKDLQINYNKFKKVLYIIIVINNDTHDYPQYKTWKLALFYLCTKLSTLSTAFMFTKQMFCGNY